MRDLLGCVLKLGVLTGLLILALQILIVILVYLGIKELGGLENPFNWKEFFLFMLGVIVLWGTFSKSK